MMDGIAKADEYAKTVDQDALARAVVPFTPIVKVCVDALPCLTRSTCQLF
jgi:hypothetical protein